MSTIEDRLPESGDRRSVRLTDLGRRTVRAAAAEHHTDLDANDGWQSLLHLSPNVLKVVRQDLYGRLPDDGLGYYSEHSLFQFLNQFPGTHSALLKDGIHYEFVYGRSNRTQTTNDGGREVESREGGDSGAAGWLARGEESEPAVSVVPRRRDAGFVGRAERLEDIRATLTVERRCVLSGPPGVGKTAVAVEYCHRYAGEYAAVVWIDAASEASCGVSFAELAQRVGQSVPPGASPEVAFRGVIGRLEAARGGPPYLVVCDDLGGAAIASRLLLDLFGERSHVLVTTRDQRPVIDGAPRPAVLDALPRADAVRLLLRRGGRDESKAAEISAAREVANELACLPLALDLAAGTVRASGLDYAAYLTSLRARRLALLIGEPPSRVDPAMTVTAALALCMDAAKAASPAAADLLTAAAFLAPDRIPEALILKGRACLGPNVGAALRDIERNAKSLDGLLSELTEYSLIQRSLPGKRRERRWFAVHSLVTEILRARLSPVDRGAWISRVAAALCPPAHGYVSELDWTAEDDESIPHLLACAALARTDEVETAEVASLYCRTGFCMMQTGDYARSETFLRAALEIRTERLGAADPATAQCWNALGSVQRRTQRYDEAAESIATALRIRQDDPGVDRLDVAESLSDLGLAFALLGNAGVGSFNRLVEGNRLVTEALALRERAGHPHRAFSLATLARIATLQRRDREAMDFLRRAIEVHEAHLGDRHPTVATCLHDLAESHVRMGEPASARPLLERSLEIRLSALGDDHADTIRTLEGLGDVLAALGDPATEAVRRRAADARAKRSERGLPAPEGRRQSMMQAPRTS